MNIDILEKDENQIRMIIDGTNPAFVNALRRVMLGRVPTLAIDDVTFIKNNSGLFDESLAHRLGLIPWKFDQKSLNKDGFVEMSLKIKGPADVKAKDIKVPKGIEAVNPELLVISLYKGQEIELEAKAKLGFGREHAKWQSAVAAYQYYPEIKIGDVKNAKEIAEACPNKVFEVKGNKLVLKNPENCSLCYRCVELSNGNIEVKDNPNKFIFSLESVSGLNPKEIMLKSVEILENDVENFRESLKSLKI